MGNFKRRKNTMKPIIIALFATVAGLATTTARADTRVSVGVNLGAPVYSRPPAVVYAPAPAYAPPPAVVYAPAPRGYWKDVTVKAWVPERWVSSRDRWGRPVRVCEPGYFTYRTDRVWVEGHADRGYAYNDRNDHRGYDNDHNRGWNR
jgi:hypothetical protein